MVSFQWLLTIIIIVHLRMFLMSLMRKNYLGWALSTGWQFSMKKSGDLFKPGYFDNISNDICQYNGLVYFDKTKSYNSLVNKI